jgi:hypothetical protein
MSERWAQIVLAVAGLAAVAILLNVSFGSRPRVLEGRSIEQWLYQLREPDSGGAELVLSQLGPEAVPLLLNHLRSLYSVPMHRTRAEQAEALAAHLRGEPQRPVAGGRLEYRIIHTLRLMGSAAIPPLITALKDPSPIVRVCATRAIGAISPEADVTLPVAVKLLDDPDWRVRDAAVTLLERMRHRRALVIPALVQVASATNVDSQTEGDLTVKVHALTALGRMGPKAKPAVAELTRLVNGPDHRLQRDAALALSRINQDTNALALLTAEKPGPALNRAR